MANSTQSLFASFSVEDVLAQMPGYIFWQKKTNIFEGCNQAAANLLGFRHRDDIKGFALNDIQIKASSFANLFIEQNSKALSGKSLTILDILSYANNEKRILLVKKYPLFDSLNNVQGIITEACDAQTSYLHKIGTILTKTKYDNKRIPVSSYVFNTYYEDFKLSTRESECIFLMIYGKSAKEISDFLNISKRTVENHIANIKQKLNFSVKSELIDWAIAHGLMYSIPKSLFSDKQLTEILQES